MVDTIERLRAEWTDRYVVIDSPAPELARFARATGIVKTVNMNGRCLVEFDQYNNVGWYDIDPSALKIVPQPLPKPAEAKPAKAAPAAKPAAPAQAAPAAGSKKPSTADILAAARAKGAAPAQAGKPAAAEKLSTAEILARARAAKAVATPPAPAAEPTVEPEAAAEQPAPAAKPAARPTGGPLPTTTAEKIAWCRAHDAKG